MARTTRSGGKAAGSKGVSDTEAPLTDPAIGDADQPVAPQRESEGAAPETVTAPTDERPAGEDAPTHDQPAAKADDAIEDAVLVEPDTASATPDDNAASPARPDQDPPDAEVESETSHPPQADRPQAPAHPVAPQSPPRPSFVPMVLGGVVAAGLGYAAAWTDLLPRPPDPAMTSRVEALAAQQTAQDSRLADLAADLGDLDARPVEDAEARDGVAGATQRIADESATLRDLIAQVEARLEAAGDEMEALSDRLTALEDRPQVTVALSEAAQAAVEAQIAALRREAAEAIARVEADRETLAAQSSERFEQLQAELRAALATVEAEQEALQVARVEAAAEAQTNRQAAAAASLRAALDAGGPYAEPLQVLAELSGRALPSALTDQAADGIPTLAALREAFPDAARAGLEAALRARMDAGEVGRVEGFMRIHSGIRSLSPQEGDDPDSVLSRAEAALAEADIAGALALIDALPPEGRSAMQAWVEQAETRRAALAGLDALGDN